jgi:hypothetical protein
MSTSGSISQWRSREPIGSLRRHCPISCSESQVKEPPFSTLRAAPKNLLGLCKALASWSRHQEDIGRFLLVKKWGKVLQSMQRNDRSTVRYGRLLTY